MRTRKRVTVAIFSEVDELEQVMKLIQTLDATEAR
jgi:hypothetical protein